MTHPGRWSTGPCQLQGRSFTWGPLDCFGAVGKPDIQCMGLFVDESVFGCHTLGVAGVKWKGCLVESERFLSVTSSDLLLANIS